MISVSYDLHNICKCIKNCFSSFPATFENVTYNLLAPRVRYVNQDGPSLIIEPPPPPPGPHLGKDVNVFKYM